MSEIFQGTQVISYFIFFHILLSFIDDFCYVSKWPNGLLSITSRGSMDLQGKVCLVTGGSSGIGASTALRLARKGARVVSASRRRPSHGRNINSYTNGIQVSFVKADLSNPEDCRNCVEQVAQDFGRLDVLVHSAGGPVPGGLYEVSDE